jgi:hypothetical protein
MANSPLCLPFTIQKMEIAIALQRSISENLQPEGILV